MDGIGWQELLIVLIIYLIMVGPSLLYVVIVSRRDGQRIPIGEVLLIMVVGITGIGAWLVAAVWGGFRRRDRSLKTQHSTGPRH